MIVALELAHKNGDLEKFAEQINSDKAIQNGFGQILEKLQIIEFALNDAIYHHEETTVQRILQGIQI